MDENLVSAIASMREEEALSITKEMLASGKDPFHILELGRKGMVIVGKRFSDGEYFVPDLIFSGEILKGISELVRPKLAESSSKQEKLGKIVFGTVAGDIHDIGKDIVVFMLDISDFEVYDLGIDVPKEKFVDKIQETGSTIVGLSGFLTLAFDSMKETIGAIERAGLRDKVKVMIGGGQIDELVRKYTGADAYGKDAMAGVTLAKNWTGGK